jgi:hypothetical protein
MRVRERWGVRNDIATRASPNICRTRTDGFVFLIVGCQYHMNDRGADRPVTRRAWITDRRENGAFLEDHFLKCRYDFTGPGTSWKYE